MRASLILVALFMVASMHLASADDCKSGERMACSSGHLIADQCYGSCPKGWYVADVDATPPGDEVDGYFPGDLTYCWQGCPGDLEVTYDIKTCGKYSNHGELSTTPAYAYDGGDLFYQDQAICAQAYPDGCELCDGEWSPITPGCDACSDFCPVDCPSDMVRQDSDSCFRNSMGRPVIGAPECSSNPDFDDGSEDDSSDEDGGEEEDM